PARARGAAHAAGAPRGPRRRLPRQPRGDGAGHPGHARLRAVGDRRAGGGGRRRRRRAGRGDGRRGAGRRMTDWTFRPLPDGSGWAAHLAAEERAALADLVDDVAALLDEGRPAAEDLPGLRIGTGPVEPPRDPAVRRLLPDASRADPDVAAEFRRLTEDDLRTTKLDQLGLLRRALTAEGPDLVVRAADAPRVAAALTDVRLVVAERLGVRTEEDADAVVRLAV